MATYNIVARVEKLCEEVCLERVREIEATMRANAPVYTGKVLQSIRTDRVGKWRWYIGPHTDHDYWAEEGNNKHGPYIYPRNGRVMSWVDPQGRRIVASRVRSHEGSHFVKKTADKYR